jgi:hypothetical protein
MQSRMRNVSLIVLALAAVVTGIARAAVTVSTTVTGGATLSVAGIGAPSFPVVLNGVDQTKTYTLSESVIDARGLSAGGGWNLTITSTQFNDGAGHTFPANASTITGVATSCGASSTCTAPTNNVANANLAVPISPSTVKYLNAANATGLGTVTVDTTVSVAVPANVFAGSYSSTVTVSIVAGP